MPAAASLQAVTAKGSTALLDATYAGLRLSSPVPAAPWSSSSATVWYSLRWLTPAQVVEAAARSEALVYAVVAREKGDPENVFLSKVTRATGGRVWTARSERELRARFLDVLDDIRSRYVLSYAPEGVAFSGWHALEVRLRQGKGEVLGRPRIPSGRFPALEASGRTCIRRSSAAGRPELRACTRSARYRHAPGEWFRRPRVSRHHKRNAS